MDVEETRNVDILEELQDTAFSQQKVIRQAHERIVRTQALKSYKIGLLFKRAKQQLFTEKQPQDFLKWMVGKLIKKDYHARRLKEFDPLEQVKLILTQAQDDLIACDPRNQERFVKKDTQRVFLFSSVPFYDIGGGQRSAQLARAFSTLGKQVYYIYAYPCGEADIPDMEIPVCAHKSIESISLKYFERRVHPGDLAIFELPFAGFEAYLDCAKAHGAYTVYEQIDNWDTSLGAMFYQEELFGRYLEKADLITVTAKNLGEKIAKKSSRPYLYLPNAVNIEIFEPAKKYVRPADLATGKKTLLYFGSLWGEWLDWEKIEYVARKIPNCAINLIGDASGCKDRRKHLPNNVHFLGVKKQTDLPAYLAYTDFALLPFKNSEIGKYVSPLKLFEYMAMNVRVLATPLEDIRDYPNVICSDTNEGWVQAVLADVPKPDNTAFIAKNNWFCRCQELLERTGSVRRVYPSVSVIVLNHNNRAIIRRCVDSLLEYRRLANYEIVVVDNQSSDGSFEMLKEEYADRILLVRNEKNGCASGRNLGVQSAHGEYLCFLDSDQWVLSNLWLEQYLHILENHAEVGAVGWACGWFQPGSARGPINDMLELRGLENQCFAYRRDIAYLGTGGLMMKKAVFEEIGGFDEAYDPTCFEDTDLSLKIRHAGLELACCPNIPLVHVPHQTTHSGSGAHEKLFRHNMEYFENKWKCLHPELLEYYLDS